MCRQTTLCRSCELNGEECLPLGKEEAASQEYCLSVFNLQDEDRCSIEPREAVNANECKRLPTFDEVVEELTALGRISGPMALMGLLLYSRAAVSMMFLGHLGQLELAGGSLSIGFANITGYSVMSGLAMGMEPICGQAFGAKRWSLIGLTLQRTVIILLCAAVPIGLLWLNMERILLWCGQDESVTRMAGAYIVSSLPDLLTQAFLHPLRIYLRTQNVTAPLAWCSGIALALHVPINYLTVVYLGMNIRGVAVAAVWTNFNTVASLACYLWWSGIYKKSLQGVSRECLKGWRSFLGLAVPSCVSVCLEWWWYEFMIIMCGLFANPKATLASMGILIQTTSLLYIFPSSLSLGVSARVGNEVGANRPGRARRATIVALACAGVLSVVAVAFTTVVRHAWGKMFTREPEILSLTSLALPVVGLCEVGNCPQTTGCGVLRGSARPSTGAGINLASFYLVGMPVAFLAGFVFKLELVGLWVGLLAAQLSCAILMLYTVLLRTDWSVQARRAEQLTATDEGKSADEAVRYEICGTSAAAQADQMLGSNISHSSKDCEMQQLEITTAIDIDAAESSLVKVTLFNKIPTSELGVRQKHPLDN